MDEPVTIITAAIVTIGSLVVAAFTRRSAKDNAVVTGYANLTTGLQSEVGRLTTRVDSLEQLDDERRRLARQHEVWDWQMVKRVRQLTNDPIPDPPPLDVWE